MLFLGPRQTCGTIVSKYHHAAQPTSYPARRHGRHSRTLVSTPAAVCPAPLVDQSNVTEPQTLQISASGAVTFSNRNILVAVGAEQPMHQSQGTELQQPYQSLIESILLGGHAAEDDRTVAAPAYENIAQPSQAQPVLHAPSWTAQTVHSSTAVQVVEATLEQQTQHSYPVESKQSATVRPSHVRRCRNVNALIGMLHKHHKSVSPQFWVTALCHLSDLLAKDRQHVPGHNWSQLQRSLLYLADPGAAVQQRLQRRWKEIQQRIQQRVSDGTWVGSQQQLQRENGVQDAALLQQHEQAPLQQFAAQDLASLVWALARIHLHLTPRQQQQLTAPEQQHILWPAVLERLTAVGDQLTPRDVAVVLWALTRMQVALPAGWLHHLIETQTAVIHSYTPQAVAMLLHCCARQSLRLHPYHTSLILSKVQQDLRRMQPRDLSIIIWSTAAMRVQPAATFMSAAMQASKLRLSTASWAEVAAFLAGTARLGFRPSGHWLLELYDQLYWTADQAELRQLVSVVWALGRLRVAVPQELLERLVAFARLQLRPLLQSHEQHQGLGLQEGTTARGNQNSSSNVMRWPQEQQQWPGLQGESATAGPNPDSDCSSSSAARQLQEQQEWPGLQDGSATAGPSPDSDCSSSAVRQLQEQQAWPGLQDGSATAGPSPDSNSSTSSAGRQLQDQQPGLQDGYAAEELRLASSSNNAGRQLQEQQQRPGSQDGSAAEGPRSDSSSNSSSSSAARQPQEQQQGLPLGLQDGSGTAGPSPDSNGNSSSAGRQPQELQDEPSSSSAARQRYMTAKLLYLLLQGLDWLKVSLGPKLQEDVADSWLPVVLSSSGTLTHMHVPVVLQACAELQISLSPAVQAAALVKLQQLQPDMNLRGFAVGLKAAVRLGCRVEPQWLQEYLDASSRLLPFAGAAEVVMLLRCCWRLEQRPSAAWLQAMYTRVLELVVAPQPYAAQQSSEPKALNPQAYGAISGGQLAAIMEHSVQLGVRDIPHELLSAASERMGELEQQGVAVAAKQRFRQAEEVLMLAGV